MVRYYQPLTEGISFGMTTSVITALGMIVGMYSATSSKLAVIAGIVIMAIADGLSDAVSLHTVKETEMHRGKARYSAKAVWLTTIFTFISVACFTLTFTIPVLLLSLRQAILVSIAWGAFLILALNFYIAKLRKESPVKQLTEHLLLTAFVIIVSYFIGGWIALAFR
jgi:VIT1/CCC1 family predicted Fe2+/Mn2+ transporter